MWLKENKMSVILYTLSIVLVLVVQNVYVSVVVVVILFISHIMALLKFKKEVSAIEQGTSIQTEEANVRADGAYDTLVNLINAIPSPLVYINQRGDFEVHNVNFEGLLEKEAVNVYDVTIDSPLRQTLLDAFLNEKQFAKQFNYKEVDFQVLSIPVHQEGRYHGCILIFQDVTSVVDGEKMQKRFIADASHELRTPITSIKGMSEIMNREGFNDLETAREFISQIDVETKRLEQIVNDLLLQSRLKSNKVYLEKSYFNLKQFFDGIIYEKRQELLKENIKVVLNCASDIMVKADQFRLSQVVLNLFNNAINYSKDQSITIKCTSSLGVVKIEFKDSGAGIPDNILPHIFERFFKGNPDRARINSGSGLGLAISKSIIEAHGGILEVESELGVGTQFTITLES